LEPHVASSGKLWVARRFRKGQEDPGRRRMRDSLRFDPRGAGVARAWSAVVVLGLLVACTWRWAPGGERQGSIVLEQRPDKLGRLERRLAEQHPSVQHRSGAEFRKWHEGSSHPTPRVCSFCCLERSAPPGPCDGTQRTERTFDDFPSRSRARGELLVQRHARGAAP